MAREAASWLYATLILAAASASIGLYRIAVAQLFAPEFEVALFYLPTLVALAVYVHARRAGGR